MGLAPQPRGLTPAYLNYSEYQNKRVIDANKKREIIIPICCLKSREVELAKNDDFEEVIPSARRLIQSERWQQYEFPSAVAELIDNSIDADATEIVIKVEFDGENSWVMVCDNGGGMPEDKLKEAMRYGSQNEYGERSQGKFGLGLKKASFSQCKHWLVATRNESPNNEIMARVWDLDHVDKTNKWEIARTNPRTLDPKVAEYLQNKTGTVILWQKLDRILEYENPNTERARKKLTKMCRDLEEHLAMVFHRFISGEVLGKKLKIILNENEIQAWDPYARNEKATKKDLEIIRIPLEFDGAHGEVIIEPYILPPKKAFSSSQAHTKAAGPNKWNQQQGFYIYRNDRMIQSGGWCRIRAPEEHIKLARFTINFSSKFDGAFKIDVSKMYVQLPPQIRKEIEEKTSPLVSYARKIYDDAEKDSPDIPPLDAYSDSSNHRQKTFVHVPIPSSSSSNAQILDQSGEISSDLNSTRISSAKIPSSIIIQEEPTTSIEKTWTLDELFSALKKEAKSSEIRVLEKLFRRLREQFQKNDVKT